MMTDWRIMLVLILFTLFVAAVWIGKGMRMLWGEFWAKEGTPWLTYHRFRLWWAE